MGKRIAPYLSLFLALCECVREHRKISKAAGNAAAGDSRCWASVRRAGATIERPAKQELRQRAWKAPKKQQQAKAESYRRRALAIKKLVCQKCPARLIGNNGAAALWERMREALLKSTRDRVELERPSYF
jgi:hypothetical protein